MRESRTYGSVRGAPRNGRPYRHGIAKRAAAKAPPRPARGAMVGFGPRKMRTMEVRLASVAIRPDHIGAVASFRGIAE